MPNQVLTDLLRANIIGLLGLQSLPDDEKSAMLEQMNELVQKRVMLRIMEVMADEDQKQMAEMEQNPQAVLAFIGEKVPNLEDIVKEEVVKLKAEMLQAAEQTP
ncbi:hypothetical protein KKC32_04445 [Patescibacteria group bacterium]|nr:hypothetical protein [Patescibacteria group bacterium]